MLKPVIKYNFLHHNCNLIIIIIARCVRRAFLCGEDKVTGQSFEHRRAWVEDKLLELTKVFCIDVWNQWGESMGSESLILDSGFVYL